MQIDGVHFYHLRPLLLWVQICILSFFLWGNNPENLKLQQPFLVVAIP